MTAFGIYWAKITVFNGLLVTAVLSYRLSFKLSKRARKSLPRSHGSRGRGPSRRRQANGRARNQRQLQFGANQSSINYLTSRSALKPSHKTWRGVCVARRPCPKRQMIQISCWLRSAPLKHLTRHPSRQSGRGQEHLQRAAVMKRCDLAVHNEKLGRPPGRGGRIHFCSAFFL